MSEVVFALVLGALMGLVIGMLIGNAIGSSDRETYKCQVHEWDESKLECEVKTIKTEKVLIDKDSELAQSIQK